MLNSIFSADEKSLQPLFGRAVCVILDDETHFTGVLTSCSSSSLTLNGERSFRPVKRKRQAKVKSDDNIVEQGQSPSTAYWGKLSMEPIERNTIKTVIPLAPVKAVMLL